MKERLRTSLAVMLSFIMALGTFSTEALAAAQLKPEDIKYEGEGDNMKVSEIHLDPYTLTNWDNMIDGDELSIDNLYKVGDKLSQYWAPIAGGIYQTYTPVTINSRDDKKAWVDWYGPTVVNGHEDHAGGCGVDVIDALKGRSKKNQFDENDTGGDRYNRDGRWRGSSSIGEGSKEATYMTSGLQYATSMNDILLEMCDMSATAWNARDKESDENTETVNERNDRSKKLYELAGEDGEGLSWMKDDAGTHSTQALYRIVSSLAHNEGRNYSNNYALIFYDFRLTALGLDEAIGKSELVEYSSDEDSTKTTSEYVENRSQRDQEESFTLSNSTVETVSNAFEHSKTITHGINAGVSVEISHEGGAPAGVSKWSQKVGFSFSTNWSKAVSTAQTEEKSISNSSESSSSTTVTVPPHTAIAINKSRGTTTKVLKYENPTVLNYKVAIVSLCWKPGPKDDEKIFSARFGSGVSEGGIHATQNLYMRAVNESTKGRLERAYGQVVGEYGNIAVSGIEWDRVRNWYRGITTQDVYDVDGCIQYAATQLPMFTSGMSMTVSTTSSNATLGNIQPIYQLTDVKLTEGSGRYAMTVGDTMSLDGLKVNGYNDFGIEYYGFLPDRGEWVLCTEDGTEIGQSDVIELDYDAGSKTKEVVAKSAGKAWITWKIADGTTYVAKDNPVTVGRNQNAPDSPIILITVNKRLTDLSGYHIEAKGEPTVMVNVPLVLKNEVDAAVINADNTIVTHTVGFEPRDQSEESPITINNGTFVSTKEGDYEVRATYTVPNAVEGTRALSPFFTVHVVGLPTATVSPTELAAEGGTVNVTFDGEALTDGMEVRLTSADGSDLRALTTGTDTQQVATFEVPANTTFDVDKVYDVTCQLAGQDLIGGQTVTVRANTLTHHAAADASCTESGNIEYWECTETSKLYADANGMQEIAAEDVFLPALGHAVERAEAAQASCTTDGSVEHWECTRCHAVFADEAGTSQIDLADILIPATGHAWGAWEDTTPATEDAAGEQTRTCANDPTHIQTRTVPPITHVHSLSKVDEVPASCTAAGSIEHWECTGETGCGRFFADDTGTNELDSTDLVIAATGHAWVEGLEIPATCTAKGAQEFSCTNGCGTTKTISLDALGHAWNEGIETTSPSCYEDGIITFTCANDPTHEKTEPIDALGHAWDAGVVTTPATCTEDGVMTYTCGNDPAHTRKESIFALGHDWGAPSYAWSKDNKTVTATRTCNNDPSHTQTENAPATALVTKAATCTAKGTKTYTATFSNPAFGAQSKTESLAALGHKWGTVKYTWSKDLKKCTAQRVCSNDNTHTKVATAKVTSKVTTKPTATKAGVRTYTATFSASWAKTKTKTSSIDPTGTPVALSNAHVQNVGWLTMVEGNKIIGTVGHSHRLEAFDLTLRDAPVTGGIEYLSHVQSIGWEPAWSRDGKMSGTSGQSKRIEAIRVRLYGNMAKKYDVYYRVHAQRYGWMGWAKNGSRAGTQGKSLRVEAMQVVLVKKGATAPSAVYGGMRQAYSKPFVK
ncbi:MAG: hypothetical protein J6S63_02225 [Atopobiaceae bacterium]|nr:hypothetical protein [Atopobiaceae bacterium]